MILRPRFSVKRKVLLGVLILAPVSFAGVMACGPFFPEPLLADRTQTLDKLPVFSFSYAIRHLYPGQHIAPDLNTGTSANTSEEENDPAEAQARQLYQSGVQAYGDPNSTDHGSAFFAAVIALPDNANAHEKTAAAFMLGKAHMASAYEAAAGPDHDLAEAARAFALTRSVVNAGGYDPDFLSQASWGEEARLYLRGADGLCGWREMESHALCTNTFMVDLAGKALTLYLHQMEAGSYAGEDSLRYVLGWLSQRPDLVTALAADPFSRKLLSLYALSYDYDEALAHSALRSLALAVRQQGTRPDDGTDLLAAAAYRQGQFDLARDFAANTQSPLAAWVRAKLAVRAGDMPAAAQAYAEATKGFPTLSVTQDPVIAARMRGEQGVLALSRGEYVQALVWLYSAAQQNGPQSDVAIDASYIAERVLTVDELKGFVDAHVPAEPPPPKREKRLQSGNGQNAGQEDTSDQVPPETMSDVMRHLLVRRLIRDNRFSEALAYTNHNPNAAFELELESGQVTTLTYDQLIHAYATALSEAKTRWTRTGRAKAWFAAARIARLYGMELTGTELAPDYYIWGGTYAGGADIDPTAAKSGAEGTISGELAAASRPFIQAQEVARFQSSAVTPNERYHYRWLAVSYASKAADLLPPRSQAFAAVLCQAAGWQTDQTEALYRRYVHDGALVDFAVRFGNDCTVKPDFEATRFYRLRRSWAHLRGMIARHL